MEPQATPPPMAEMPPISEMPPGPSTSSISDYLSPPKKRPRKSMSATEKLMVMNVYKNTYKHWAQGEVWSLGACAKKVAELLGLSAITVQRILKEHKATGTLRSPKKTGSKTNCLQKMDEYSFSAIRRIVHQFYRRNEIPTVAKILQAVNEDANLPNLSKTKLQKVLKHLKFKYTSRKRKSCLIDREDITLWRQKYLSLIKQHRRDEKFIYYQDETWLNEGHTVKKVWVDTEVQSSRDAFLEGLTTGLKAPSGKGKRLIISHIGSEEGFVDGALLLFESKKNSDDYHKEINSECFEDWFKQVLPKLKPNSVLVMDNAPYHSRKVERTPTTAWKKADIQAWLRSKNIAYVDTMIKAQLMKIVKENKSQYNKYVVDELAAQSGVTILRLPPYHCELNPIELVWAQVKGHVARNNKTFKMLEVKKLLEEGLREVTPEKWKNCINHIKKIENEMCQLNHIIDDVQDRFIINTRESDSESDSDMSEEC